MITVSKVPNDVALILQAAALVVLFNGFVVPITLKQEE